MSTPPHPPQNNSTPFITINKSLTIPCAKCTIMGSTNFSILIPKHFVIFESWTNWLLLNPRNNTTSCYLILHLIFNKLHASPKAIILILNPSYKMSNLTLPLVGWGNLLLGAPINCSWNIWCFKQIFFIFFLRVPSLIACWTSFTFTFHCSYWVLHLCVWLHVSTPFATDDDGHCLSYIPPTSSNHSKSLKCLLVRRLMFDPTILGLARKPISLQILTSKE
jgi:hypothetical protein